MGRWVCVFVMLAQVAIAQTSGGSTGSGGLGRGRGTGTEDAPRTGGGHSDPFPAKQEPMFPKSPTVSTPPRAPTAQERAAAEERAKASAAWSTSHRTADFAALSPEEVALIPAPPFSIFGVRWPHLLIGVMAAMLALFLMRSEKEISEASTRAGTLMGNAQEKAKELLGVNKLSSLLTDASSGSATRLRVTLGFDWSVRPGLQKALERLTAKEPGSDLSRLNLYRAVVDLFEPALPGVRYALVEEVHGNANQTERSLHDTTLALRARYAHETAGRGHEKVDVVARPLEGQGLLVVSVLVGLTEGRDEREPIGTWAPLRRLVERLREIDSVPMLEVIWSPAKEDDRLSSAELEVLYPELERVGAARLGRVVCESCKAVYAAELGACPSCGASAATAAKHANAGPCPYCGAVLPAHETHCETCGAFVEAAVT